MMYKIEKTFSQRIKGEWHTFQAGKHDVPPHLEEEFLSAAVLNGVSVQALRVVPEAERASPLPQAGPEKAPKAPKSPKPAKVADKQ